MNTMNDLLQTIITTIKKILDQFTQPAAPTAKTNTPPTSTPKPTVAPQVKVAAPTPIKVEETVKPIVAPETSATTEAVIVPAVEVIPPATVTPAPAKTATTKTATDNLPEDSIQRRHAIAELQNRIETLYGEAPSDSILSRHHTNHINSVIVESLTNKEFLDLLTGQYESLKTNPTATASPALETSTPAATETVSATEIRDIPTDSILKRHYDTMINNELNSLLENGK